MEAVGPVHWIVRRDWPVSDPERRLVGVLLELGTDVVDVCGARGALVADPGPGQVLGDAAGEAEAAEVTERRARAVVEGLS